MNETEKTLLKRYLETGVMDERLLLINKGILDFIYQKYFLSFSFIKDDLMQEGLLGLLEAFNRFDESREGGFFNYKKLWVRKKMQVLAYKQSRINSFSDLKISEPISFWGSSCYRLERIQNVIDLVESCDKISIHDKIEIAEAIKGNRPGFKNSKTFAKLRKLVSYDKI